MDKHDISVFLKSARIASSMTVNEVVDALQLRGIEISAKTLYGWESGHRQPDADMFVSLCSIYNVQSFSEIEKVNYIGAQRISSREMSLLENYRKLTDKGRAAVDATLDRELAVLELLEIVNKQEQEKAKRNANPFTPEETEKLINGHKYTVEAAAYGGQSSTTHLTKEENDLLYKDLMKGRKD